VTRLGIIAMPLHTVSFTLSHPFGSIKSDLVNDERIEDDIEEERKELPKTFCYSLEFGSIFARGLPVSSRGAFPTVICCGDEVIEIDEDIHCKHDANEQFRVSTRRQSLCM